MKRSVFISGSLVILFVVFFTVAFDIHQIACGCDPLYGMESSLQNIRQTLSQEKAEKGIYPSFQELLKLYPELMYPFYPYQTDDLVSQEGIYYAVSQNGGYILKGYRLRKRRVEILGFRLFENFFDYKLQEVKY